MGKPNAPRGVTPRRGLAASASRAPWVCSSASSCSATSSKRSRYSSMRVLTPGGNLSSKGIEEIRPGHVVAALRRFVVGDRAFKVEADLFSVLVVLGFHGDTPAADGVFHRPCLVDDLQQVIQGEPRIG